MLVAGWVPSILPEMKSEGVIEYYEQPGVVEHYQTATARVGLWASEEIVFTQVFGKDDRILELGCGTGRIALGLAEIGYKYLLGIDWAKEMVMRARRIAGLLEEGVSFQVGDARKLDFEDNLFDGAIFGFNGLMQIPGRGERFKAMREINRVIRSGGYFCFTAHDRGNPRQKNFWAKERQRWEHGKQDPGLVEFGDRIARTDHGLHFIHVPDSRELREDLSNAGFVVEMDRLRSQISNENAEVRSFSDDCRFWVTRKR